MSNQFLKLALTMSVSALATLSISQATYGAGPGGANGKRTICKYDAAPQGFEMEIYELVQPNGSSLGNRIKFRAKQSRYFTGNSTPISQSLCPGPNDPSQVKFGKCLIGSQNTGSLIGGLFNAGKGFARDSVNIGSAIDGNVYVVMGHPTQPAWSGAANATYDAPTGLFTCTNFTAMAAALNMPSPNRPSGLAQIPVANAVSEIYNDQSFIKGGNTTAPATLFNDPNYDPFSWVDQQEKDWHAFGLIMGNTTGDWGHYIRGYYEDFDPASGDPYASLGTMNRQEYLEAKDRFMSMGMGDYFTQISWDHTSQNFVYQKLEAAPLPPLQIIEIEDDDLIIVPRGWGSPDYPKPQQIAGSGGVTVTSIYPSNLYDPPKHPNYYLGTNGAAGGPGTPTFNHAPLPAKCNPAREEYIPAAFFYPSYLEELRLDWKYLSQSNWDDLQAKGFDFLQDYTQDYTTSCAAENNGLDGGDCLEHIVAHSSEPDSIVRPILPGQTMPANPTSPIRDGVGKKGNEVMARTKETGSKIVPKRKTEVYYSDLINNKMIVMNLKWNRAHKMTCRPQVIAITGEGIEGNVKKPKKVTPLKKKKVEAKSR